MVLSLTAVMLVGIAGFNAKDHRGLSEFCGVFAVKWDCPLRICDLLAAPQADAAEPKTIMGSRGSAVFVDTTLLNVRDAKRAITGRNLRVRGTPVDADPNNGTLELKAKDGTITVSGIHYPADIRHLAEEGFQIQVEIEGGIKRRKVNNDVTFYASEIRRMTWEARDESGTVVQKGERKGIQ